MTTLRGFLWSGSCHVRWQASASTCVLWPKVYIKFFLIISCLQWAVREMFKRWEKGSPPQLVNLFTTSSFLSDLFVVSASLRWPIVADENTYYISASSHWISWSLSRFARISNLTVDMLSVNTVTWVRRCQDVPSWWVRLPPDQWGMLLCPGPLLLPHPDRRVSLLQPLSSVQSEGARGEMTVTHHKARCPA